MLGGKEKRFYERLNTSLPVFLQNQLSASPENKALLEDVSAGGLRIKTLERLPIGDEISIGVQFPQQKAPLIINGKVSWAHIRSDHMWDIGIKFSYPMFSKLSSLVQYCYN